MLQFYAYARGVTPTRVWILKLLLQSWKCRSKRVGKFKEHFVHDQHGFLAQVRFRWRHLSTAHSTTTTLHTSHVTQHIAHIVAVCCVTRHTASHITHHTQKHITHKNTSHSTHITHKNTSYQKTRKTNSIKEQNFCLKKLQLKKA